ncbi:hypothetical protein CEXT_436111 [Caerostris extrusa]|uniref:Uncharacterized protein n=1 Tax=Caerostris extrusa TaxID=172846 RepID=A0AAV4MNX7_CAEEX|nr:hypothetical protein CEXT_436111 [Caerostris extrusa]
MSPNESSRFILFVKRGWECFCVHPKPADKKSSQRILTQKREIIFQAFHRLLKRRHNRTASGSNGAWGCQLKKSPMRMIHQFCFESFEIAIGEQLTVKKLELSKEQLIVGFKKIDLKDNRQPTTIIVIINFSSDFNNVT